ncbi:MAG: nitronate monooxygenase [Ilumatobacteraceae bacterium]
MQAVVRRTAKLTDRPFGVDLILPARLEQTGARVSDVAARLPQQHLDVARRIASDLGVEPRASDGRGDRQALGTDAEAQIGVVVEEQVPVFVGALGTPAAFAARLHDAGIMVMSVVGSTKQAVQVARDGADVVIAQGTEGGGHTGHVGTLALLPQVLDTVDVPVVAAGGIGDGRGLAAALVMGCEGVWVGTRFLATLESGLADWQKAELVAAADQSPVISRAYTGKRFRLLPSRWTEQEQAEVRRSGCRSSRSSPGWCSVGSPPSRRQARRVDERRRQHRQVARRDPPGGDRRPADGRRHGRPPHRTPVTVATCYLEPCHTAAC